ncbi:MAG: hypothetical protein M0R33_15325 [Methylomonas sp.]|jgi:hypothetical protein|uniref:hypothetical protein n=1 Tax=Methylomonas sp. TaxID=418 RepID=UPI0025FF6058|nr:hypothetical protein [Methylomonas sp.]MCK9607813.1 hypothetical protein [Methylomonas sp.]
MAAISSRFAIEASRELAGGSTPPGELCGIAEVPMPSETYEQLLEIFSNKFLSKKILKHLVVGDILHFRQICSDTMKFIPHPLPNDRRLLDLGAIDIFGKQPPSKHYPLANCLKIEIVEANEIRVTSEGTAQCIDRNVLFAQIESYIICSLPRKFWEHFCIAGGYALHLFGEHFADNPYIPYDDIDFFPFGMKSQDQFVEYATILATAIDAAITKYNKDINAHVFCAALITEHSLTFHIWNRMDCCDDMGELNQEICYSKFQIILANSPSMTHVLRTFDLDCCRYAYRDGHLYSFVLHPAEQPALECIVDLSSFDFVHLDFHTVGVSFSRVMKYITKGVTFRIRFPVKRTHRIKTTIDIYPPTFATYYHLTNLNLWSKFCTLPLEDGIRILRERYRAKSNTQQPDEQKMIRVLFANEMDSADIVTKFWHTPGFRSIKFGNAALVLQEIFSGEITTTKKDHDRCELVTKEIASLRNIPSGGVGRFHGLLYILTNDIFAKILKNVEEHRNHNVLTTPANTQLDAHMYLAFLETIQQKDIMNRCIHLCASDQSERMRQHHRAQVADEFDKLVYLRDIIAELHKQPGEAAISKKEPGEAAISKTE